MVRTVLHLLLSARAPSRSQGMRKYGPRTHFTIRSFLMMAGTKWSHLPPQYPYGTVLLLLTAVPYHSLNFDEEGPYFLLGYIGHWSRNRWHMLVVGWSVL